MKTLSGAVYLPSEGFNYSNNTNSVLGANIHKAGLNNYTGTYNGISSYSVEYKYGAVSSTPFGTTYGFTKVSIPNYRYSGVSEGCFLIDRTNWNNFMKHFPVGVGRIGVINK